MHICSRAAKFRRIVRPQNSAHTIFLALKTEALVLDALSDIRPDRFTPGDKVQDIYSIREFTVSNSRCEFYT